jgi:hypothetical protein
VSGKLTTDNFQVDEDNHIVTYVSNATLKDQHYFANNLIIPDHILYNGDEYTVHIGPEAFNFLYSGVALTGTVTLPTTLQTIETDAFGYQENLTNVIFPDTLTTISSFAFQGCGLTSITFNNALQTIGTSSFQGCSSLTGTLSFPSTIQTIQEHSFDGCSSLSELALPTPSVSIAAYIVNGCSSITSIVGSYLHNFTPSSIQANAFSGLPSLGTVSNSVAGMSSGDLLTMLISKGLPNT